MDKSISICLGEAACGHVIQSRSRPYGKALIRGACKCVAYGDHITMALTVTSDLRTNERVTVAINAIIRRHNDKKTSARVTPRTFASIVFPISHRRPCSLFNSRPDNFLRSVHVHPSCNGRPKNEARHRLS